MPSEYRQDKFLCGSLWRRQRTGELPHIPLRILQRMDINLESAANLIAEIITGSKFDDQCMIHELLRQAIVWMEQNIIDSGSGYAMTRIAAGHSAQGVVRECTGALHTFSG